MAFPTIFANLPAGVEPLSLFDTMFNVVGSMGVVACTATGTNTIALAPKTNMPTVSAYANYQAFGFVAANTTSGLVTININGVGALNAYASDGATQLASGALVAGAYYVFVYNSALNSAVGGFQIIGALSGGGGGSGGLTLLATVNASGASSVVFSATYITSAYNKYVVEIDGLFLGTASQALYLTLSTNNGSTYLSANYEWVSSQNRAASTSLTSSGSTSDSQISLGAIIGTASAAPSAGTIKLANLTGANQPNVEFRMSGGDSILGPFNLFGTGTNSGTTATNNIKFAASSGTITGNFHLYGLARPI